MNLQRKIKPAFTHEYGLGVWLHVYLIQEISMSYLRKRKNYINKLKLHINITMDH